ncbi:ABC transporter ATP-binding protein [Actinokineospora sp. HUAS TT18]|uniref:ABC transporter ATP-binding protein n=1 Tax=Actinokineospora sp. HUAS TT18 TaxID=3447451 RepID=UPI003F525D79
MTIEQITELIDPHRSDQPDPVLRVRELVTRFHTGRGVVRAVDGVSFDLAPGETLGIVGESGSGKSVAAMSLLRMVRRPGRVESGQVLYHGQDLLALSEPDMRRVRGGGIGMVFQDPMSSLNPVMRVRDQLVEAMRTHGKFTGEQAARRAVELMERVGIPDPSARLADYPHAFSGGMRQRVMIAMALANQPDVIIADEPTTALDVTIQAQILDLLAELNRDLGTAVILITHNLGVVARMCSRVAVMYGGRIVEQAPVADLFAAPRHPYTRALLRATPRLTGSRDLPLVAIDGRPPNLIDAIPGCAFAPRCAHADAQCAEEAPLTVRARGREWVCWRSAETGVLPPLPAAAVGSSGRLAAVAAGEPLLRVENLAMTFPVTRRTGLFRSVHGSVSAVDDVSLAIAPGETLGLVGESGCGKSTLGKVLLGVHHPVGGKITFADRDVTVVRKPDLGWFRRAVQLVFQDPMSSLNPRLTVGQAVREPLEIHGIARGGAADRRVAELFDLVGLDATAAGRYPHEFSGGQRQRVVIARALAVEPDLLVCDEAVSALDVSLQAQILNLLRDLQQRLGLAYLFIGHDLATVRHVSHRIAVMYLGRIVETGPADLVTAAPAHPYTVSLLSAAPEPDPVTERTRERILLTGDVPSPLAPPPGCRFHTRCPIGPKFRPERTVCATETPALRPTPGGTHAACHFAGELLGRVVS